MNAIIFLIIGLVVGTVIGALIVRSRLTAEAARRDSLTAEIETLKQTAAEREQTLGRLQDERTQLISERDVQTARADSTRKEAEQTIQTLKQTHQEQLQHERETAAERLAKADNDLKRERETAADLRRESDQRWQEKMETLRQDMLKKAAEMFIEKSNNLQDVNRKQMDELFRPVKEQFEAFKRSVDESRTSNETSKKTLEKTFEDTMKLFEHQQKTTIDLLREQTERIGNDAANLTKALKGESKTQGDWGEMVLDTLLEQSGLRKGEEYFVQENVKDDENNNLRPDVVVRFPEGRAVVIDSKVSLTAYADAVTATNDADRDLLLRRHVESVKKHVDELAEKNYSAVVQDAIGFVLMFIPNESSYIAAIKQQPDLSHYAYLRRIIIISPSNLLMALQLAYNLWQYDRQTKNTEKIVKTAADLYDKVAGFTQTFNDLGTQIQRLSNTFTKANDQLQNGKGNVVRRVDALKELGVNPKKQLKGAED